MSQMIVRPPSLWINPFGNLAEEYSVYVGKPFQDPTQASSQLTVKDGRGEDANIVMQPIIVTEGVTRNRSGQKILPVIDSQNYSLLYVSTNGSRIYSESSFFGDGLSSTGEGGALAEEVLNNLQQALSSDLTGFNYIFIQSEFIGWEGTSEGPTVNSLYYYNGGSGPSSTGDVFTFYDSAGNEWTLAKSVTEQTNENEIIINRGLIDDNAAQIASNSGDISNNATAAAAAQAAAVAAQSTANTANSTANTANSKANANTTAINQLPTPADYVVQSGSNFKRWNEGARECWGNNVVNVGTIVSYPISMNSNCSVVATYNDGDGVDRGPITIGNKTSSGFTVTFEEAASGSSQISWRASTTTL